MEEIARNPCGNSNAALTPGRDQPKAKPPKRQTANKRRTPLDQTSNGNGGTARELTCELLLEMDTNTSVRELRDLFIATVSFSLSPVALDRLSLSLPARSTRCSVPFRDDR